MPITDSAKKAMRQTATNRARNLIRKDAYKQALKKFRKLIVGKNFDDAPEALKTLYKTVDKAAKRNVIKPNKAGRLKSRASQLMAKESKDSS